MAEVALGSVSLGGETTKIIIPVSDLEQVGQAVGAGGDIFEIRADLAGALTSQLASRLAPFGPLLLTLRSTAEGGACAEGEYAGRVRELLSLQPQAIDVEIARPEAAVLIEAAHRAGVVVFGSFHSFSATPPVDQVLARLIRASEAGADVCKIAVMPQHAHDVLTLLEALARARQQIDRPLIGIAMGKLGQISRLAGPQFGNCATFATAGPASAPGQMDAVLVRKVLGN